MVTQSYLHEGPLPHPAVLERYDHILPGAAERILTMAEQQSNHRQELEKVAIKAGARDSLLGLIFGFVIGLATVLGGVFAAYHGQEQGFWLSGGGIAALVGVFVYGSRQKRQEREKKALMLKGSD